MRERFTHISHPQGLSSSPLRAGAVHTVHTPYCFFDTCFKKINVIGTPYDLWRRAS